MGEYERVEDKAVREQKAEREAHNARVEQDGLSWCSPCFRKSGIKRPLGVATFGLSRVVPTCPVCGYEKPDNDLLPTVEDVPF